MLNPSRSGMVRQNKVLLIEWTTIRWENTQARMYSSTTTVKEYKRSIPMA